MDFNELLTSKKVLICCGSGGVGKTTLSAALGVKAADLGLKVLVLTIDPARRLANSLGLDQLGEDDLSRPYSHYQPGPSSDPDHERPVGEWVGVNTFEHYAEHLPLIRSAARQSCRRRGRTGRSRCRA